MKKDMPLEGLRWSRDSGSALYDTPQNGRSRTGWGNIAKYSIICMFRKHFEAIVPFSEIIFVLLQVYLPILYI